MIGVLCAMQKEYDLLCENLHNRHSQSDDIVIGTMDENESHCLVVAKSGIGKVNAAIMTKSIINYGVSEILSVGVAGGADKSVAVGDIVIGNSYCYHDVWCGKPNKPGQIQGLPSVFPSGFGKWIQYVGDEVIVGTIATGDWFVQSPEELERIKNFLPATHNVIAVDMESAAIAQVCYKENIPFTSIRVISDNPLYDVQQSQYERFWNDMSRKSFETLMQLICCKK